MTPYPGALEDGIRIACYLFHFILLHSQKT
jgi:hypothetical protein